MDKVKGVELTKVDENSFAGEKSENSLLCPHCGESLSREFIEDAGVELELREQEENEQLSEEFKKSQEYEPIRKVNTFFNRVGSEYLVLILSSLLVVAGFLYLFKPWTVFTVVFCLITISLYAGTLIFGLIMMFREEQLLRKFRIKRILEDLRENLKV